MSVMRDELHHLVDLLPEEKLAPALALVRKTAAPGARERAVAALEQAQAKLRGVTGIDEELRLLRDEA
ncbi:MAG: hypothetical protein ACRDNZ_02005 [Streptosporangiaceae bacterium]